MIKNKQFAVLGLGRFGQSIVKTLTHNNCEVLACDSDANRVHEVSQFATHVVQLDFTDEFAMKELGLGNFDVVILAMASNLEASIMAAMMAKENGCKYVLSKANSYLQKDILEKLGVDRVVLPEREMGEKIALNLINNNILDTINLSEDFSIVEITPIIKWVGLPLRKSNIRAEYGLNILAIKRNNKIIVSPKPEEVILENDILVAIGELSDIQRLYSASK